MRLRALLAAMAALACLAAAADPAERLANPVQEARARALFAQVRCVVCQNESIDDSEADLAHDLRQTIRGQIALGQSDGQVRGYLVHRYGEFILLKPSFSAGNAGLWLTPFLIAVLGGGVLLWRRRRNPVEVQDLTEEEEARLARLPDA